MTMASDGLEIFFYENQRLYHENGIKKPKHKVIAIAIVQMKGYLFMNTGQYYLMPPALINHF